jgi:hypothetical protein
VRVGELVIRWESRHSELARLHAQVDGAALVEEFLSDLERLASAETAMSLAEASRLSGYSADHLGRLVRKGEISNRGRKNAPKVLLSECPRKAKKVVGTGHARRYDVDTDALSLVGSRR